MPRNWAFLLGGILMGFGFLFFTIWSKSVADAGSLAAVMFACAAVMFGTARTPGKGKAACKDAAQTKADVA